VTHAGIDPLSIATEICLPSSVQPYEEDSHIQGRAEEVTALFAAAEELRIKMEDKLLWVTWKDG
jgi:hypothetical protein